MSTSGLDQTLVAEPTVWVLSEPPPHLVATPVKWRAQTVLMLLNLVQHPKILTLRHGPRRVPVTATHWDQSVNIPRR
jgi:hypothetical protein